MNGIKFHFTTPSAIQSTGVFTNIQQFKRIPRIKYLMSLELFKCFEIQGNELYMHTPTGEIRLVGTFSNQPVELINKL